MEGDSYPISHIRCPLILSLIITGHYDRMRSILESVYESFPQATLQIFLLMRNIEGDITVYFSLVIAVLNTFRNIYIIYRGALSNDETLFQHITRIFQVGVGHIPHIALIREGRATEVIDFSETPSELFIAQEFMGLQKVFDAMIVGKGNVSFQTDFFYAL